MGNFIASLKTHVRSLFDADIKAEELACRIIEMGGKGCAITDSGVVSAIEDYRRVFAGKGLKLVPGCEVTISGGDSPKKLVLLAKNDKGYQGIGKIVTESNKTLNEEDEPVISFKTLVSVMKKYKGDIIAMSGSVNGVIPLIYLSNHEIDAQIEKKQDEQAKYCNPADGKYMIAENAVKETEKSLETLESECERVKRIAGAKFATRIKAVEKLEKSGDTEAKEARLSLEKDMEAQKEASAMLPDLKKEVSAKKRTLNEQKKNLSKLTDSVDEWFKVESEIEALKRELKSEEELEVAAENNAKTMQKIFGEDCFYIELEYHGAKGEKEAFSKTAALAKRLGIPVVATNNVHILTNTSEERLKRQMLRSIGNDDDTWLPEEEGDAELYLKDDDELRIALLQIADANTVNKAISNIEKIFDSCNVTFEAGKHYPKFADNADDILDEEIRKGVIRKFPDGLDEEHRIRLEYELGIIKKMGYSNYHLIVKDFLEYGRLLGYVPKDELDNVPLTIEGLKKYIDEKGYKNGGMVIGPGRGSAVGSLACYVLDITAVDPMKHNLLFERFLNPERVSMPDIDSDISKTTRAKVIEYVKNKYGKDAVCGILTTTISAPKGAIRSAGKYYGLKYFNTPLTALADTIARDVPSDPGVSFSTPVDGTGKITGEGTPLYDYLVAKYKKNANALGILEWAKTLEGSLLAYGAHAAGIVISDNDDISDYLPLRMNENLGIMTTQCDMVQVEENGLLKFDFLGLRTLDIITDTVKLIEARTGVIIDPLKIELDDKRVYEEVFSTARTGGIFQFNKPGVRTWLKKFKPSSFEDIIILNAMNRPGPMQYLDDVCEVKNGIQEVKFLCDELKPILGVTYGAIVYQEQVMEIFQKLAGYSLGGADSVRRYMSKKKADKLAHEREAFVNGDEERGIAGCVKNGIPADVANALFDQMQDFASYAFNKSHALVYSLDAYICAWLKLYYPAEFYACALNWAQDIKGIAELIGDAKACGTKVEAPNINLSGVEFTAEGDSVMFGLSNIKGISNFAKKIIAERANGAFVSLNDFCKRTRPDKTVVENLIFSGAFDSFGTSRTHMLLESENSRELFKEYFGKEDAIKSIRALLPVIEPLKTENDVIAYQRERELKVVIKKPTDTATLNDKLEKTLLEMKEIEKEFEKVYYRPVSENRLDLLNKEAGLLGTFVSSDPIDFYPSALSLKCPDIIDVDEGGSKAYGVISGLQIKERKKDGAKMAFFSLTDRTGSLDVAVFVDAYAKYKDLIAEGRAVIITGKCEVTYLDEENSKKQFIAKTMTAVEEKKEAYVLNMSKEAWSDVKDEYAETYGQADGHQLYLYDDGHYIKITGLMVSDMALVTGKCHAIRL